MESKLNVLVNNAGISDKMFALNDDGIEIMLAVNYFGTYVFTKTLLSLMKKTSSVAGSDVRIVTLSSMSHDMSGSPEIKFSDPAELRDSFPAKDWDTWANRLIRYGRSKLAVILFSNELQRRLDGEGTSIISMTIHPGTVATEASLSVVANMPVAGSIAAWIASWVFLSEPEGARTTVFAAADPVIRAESEKFKGKYLTPIGKITEPSKLAQDSDLAKRLWDFSETTVNAKSI